MEIKITSDVNGAVFRMESRAVGVSVAGVGNGEADEMQADFQRNVEEIQYLRAKGIENADRGNVSVDLQVSITQYFANARDSALFLLDLNNAPTTGRVEITINDNGLKGVRVIEKAGIHRITPVYNGTSCRVTFHIRGGVVSKPSSSSSS